METERFVSFVKSVIKSQPIPPHYNPDAWKGKIFNCYAYALRACVNFKNHEEDLVPGFISSTSWYYRDDKEVLIKLFLKDLEALGLKAVSTTAETNSVQNSYKIAIYIEEGKDFHFIRQDSDGNWSEKDGMYGKIRIVNPENINKNRDSYEFVGVFMITKKE